MGLLVFSLHIVIGHGGVFSVSLFAIVQWGSPGALQFSHDVSLRKLICIFDGITCRLKITNRFIPSPKTQCGFSKCKERKTSKVNAQFWSIIGREGELFFFKIGFLEFGESDFSFSMRKWGLEQRGLPQHQ